MIHVNGYALHTHTHTKTYAHDMSQYQSQIYDCNNMWLCHMHDFIHSTVSAFSAFFLLKRTQLQLHIWLWKLQIDWLDVCYASNMSWLETIRAKMDKQTKSPEIESCNLWKLGFSEEDEKEDAIVWMLLMIHCALTTHTHRQAHMCFFYLIVIHNMFDSFFFCLFEIVQAF